MKMDEKKSLSGNKEEVADAMENIVIGKDGKEVDSEDVIMKYAGNPEAYNQNPPSMRGVSAGGFSKSLFKSASAAKSGSPCASHDHPKADKGPVWAGGKTSDDKPDERDEKEDGQYLPPSMKMVEKDGEYKVVKKSLFASAELSKAVGRAQKGSSTSLGDAGLGTKRTGSSVSPGKLKMDPALSQPIKEKPKGVFDSRRGKGLLEGKKLKAPMLGAKGEKIAAAASKGPSKVTEQSLRIKDKHELESPGYRRDYSVDDAPGSKSYTGAPEVEWEPEGKKRSVFKHGLGKSLTELRYGSQLSRTYDIGKSCGVCGKISKSVGEEGHEGHSGCCADCRKSMNSVRWHDSHLS